MIDYLILAAIVAFAFASHRIQAARYWERNRKVANILFDSHETPQLRAMREIARGRGARDDPRSIQGEES